MKNLNNTVIVITYNQENLICRALDSLLCQKEFICEILVFDDCSTDKTWDVVHGYKNRYPELIKLFRNPHNLGIFRNIESTWSKPTGDIIWYLSGDDVYCKGVFEEANKLIEKHNIEYKREAFTLYFDYKAISPTGEETVFRNNLVELYNPISLKIRQLICNRTTGVSRKVFEQFYPVRKDIGIMADGLIDIQTQLFSDKSYYAPFIGSNYYTSIGINSRTKRETVFKSYILSIDQLKLDIKNIPKDDGDWLNYLKSQLSFLLKPTPSNYLSYLKLFIIIIRTNKYGWTLIKRETKSFIKGTKNLIFNIASLKK